MTPYYVKQNDIIFKFGGWTDFENVTGRDRSLYGKMPLAKAIRLFYTKSRIIGRWAAYFEGWIDNADNPKEPYKKGNANWT